MLTMYTVHFDLIQFQLLSLIPFFLSLLPPPSSQLDLFILLYLFPPWPHGFNWFAYRNMGNGNLLGATPLKKMSLLPPETINC